MRREQHVAPNCKYARIAEGNQRRGRRRRSMGTTMVGLAVAFTTTRHGNVARAFVAPSPFASPSAVVATGSDALGSMANRRKENNIAPNTSTTTCHDGLATGTPSTMTTTGTRTKLAMSALDQQQAVAAAPALGRATDPAIRDADLPELNHDEVRRYSRHLILPDVGVSGQRRLKASSVLAVGTGGLGSPALLYLAAAGVGRLGIVDDDVVDESNLQRQVGWWTIHRTSYVSCSSSTVCMLSNQTWSCLRSHSHTERGLRSMQWKAALLSAAEKGGIVAWHDDVVDVLWYGSRSA